MGNEITMIISNKKAGRLFDEFEELIFKPEFYNIETLYFEITSLEEMTEKVKKYMLSEAGVLELEAYIKKKIGEEIDELFLNRGDPNGK